MWVILVMFSICFHEYAHAYIALKQGDSTAAEKGHLSLNPMIQMGTVSIVMLLIIGISWGAVPVNPSRMKHKYSHALVSFAGPAANLLLFLIFCLLTVLFQNTNVNTYKDMFYLGAKLNMVLFLFNMLPVPILDGWTVFSYIFPKLREVGDEVKNGMVFMVFVLFFMTDLFNGLFVFGEKLAVFVIRTLLTIAA